MVTNLQSNPGRDEPRDPLTEHQRERMDLDNLTPRRLGRAAAIRLLAGFGLAVLPLGALPSAAADLLLAPQGEEYLLSRGLIGDQTRPALALGEDGGFVVWQDNAVDGSGLGIMAVRLNASLSPIPTRMFRVNETTVGDQEAPSVELLPEGGALVVWQGGPTGHQDIWARLLDADGRFLGGEFRVNTHTNGQQMAPQLARLQDGNLVVVWSSLEQDGHLQGVYAQRLSPTGERLGGEFQVNQFSAYNQRTPAVAGLEDGSFVVVWISEQQRFENSVDVYARRFAADGAPLGDEQQLNPSANLCANPAVAPGWNGGVMVAWSERDLTERTNMWDVVMGSYNADLTLRGSVVTANQYLPHNQFAPRIAALGNTRLVVWTSYGQDGSREGVYGRLVGQFGALADEFRVNTTTVSRQLEPAVVSDGKSRFLVAWTGFVGDDASVEILGQRFAAELSLPTPAAPLVVALDAYSLMVSWAPLAGYPNLAAYHLYLDGAATPVVVTNNFHVVDDLNPASSHTFRLAYALTDGRISPLSEPASGRTWGRDRNNDGLPDDWQAQYWGASAADWPSPGADPDGDGASTLAEFLAGTDPTDPSSVLKLSVQPTTGGLLLQWNATAGSVYQLQMSTNLTSWSDAAGPAFAPGDQAASVIPISATASYYRVIRLR